VSAVPHSTGASAPDRARLRFGLIASHQFPEEEDLRTRVNDLFDLVGTAAELGYDSVFAINHFLANLRTPQVFSMTASLLGISGSMTVGTGILLLPLLHPVQVAEEFATLDQLSGGRMVLGVGAGYRQEEFDAFGIPLSERASRLAEGVRLIRELWRDEPIDFSGRFHQVRGRIGISPLTPGGPPIWIGAGAPVAVRRAATLGDAWLAPGNAPDPRYLPRALSWHDEALAEAGKPREGREYPVMVELFCGQTDAEAREAALPHIKREYTAYGEYEALAWQRDQFDTLVANTFIIGSPDTVTARLESLVAAGFNHVIFRPWWTGMPTPLARASVELVGREVIPRFANERG